MRGVARSVHLFCLLVLSRACCVQGDAHTRNRVPQFCDQFCIYFLYFSTSMDAGVKSRIKKARATKNAAAPYTCFLVCKQQITKIFFLIFTSYVSLKYPISVALQQRLYAIPVTSTFPLVFHPTFPFFYPIPCPHQSKTFFFSPKSSTPTSLFMYSPQFSFL